MLCQHCQRATISRPRRLCWNCYYTPGVRSLYPPTSKYARRGLGQGSGPAPLPDQPTQAAPGTEAKIEILRQRAEMRCTLWHPQDNLSRSVTAELAHSLDQR